MKECDREVAVNIYLG